MRHAKWRGSTFIISIALKRVFEDAAVADEETVMRSDEVSRRSLVSASRCMRAYAGMRGFCAFYCNCVRAHADNGPGTRRPSIWPLRCHESAT